MSYDNRRQYRNNGNEYHNNRYGNSNNQQRQQRKHSGAKTALMQKGSHSGETCIVAWNYSRNKGLVKVLITPYKNTREHTSKSGRIWENYMVTVFYTKSGHKMTTSALVDTASGKAIIKELGWVVNPKARNGGYCGTFVNRN